MLNKKSIISILLIAIIFLFTSCDVIKNCVEIYQSTKQYDSASAISSSELTDSSKNNSEQQNTGGKFDIEEVRKKLWLNGKQFTIPCTANDLGEEYNYDKFTLVKTFRDQPDPTYYTAILFSNVDNKHMGIFLKNVTLGSDLRNKEIRGINIIKGNAIDFKVDKIGVDSSRDDILNTFGNPTAIWGEDTDDIQIYRYVDPENEDNRFVIYYHNKTNSISQLDFTYMGEEN